MKAAGADQYTVWNTDSNGNVTFDSIGAVSGTNVALESLEPSFHQDLNGDGVIGAPATAPAIQAGIAISAPAKTAIASASADVLHAATDTRDTFVFKNDFDNGKIGTNPTDLDHTAFASVFDLSPRVALDHGNEIATIVADQSILTHEISSLLLPQHVNDFHLV